MAQYIAITNLKGGSAKTTSTAHLAHAFAQRGSRVMVVDADPQGSTLRWSSLAEWNIPTISLPVKNLHTRLSGITPADVDLVLIDSPPLDEHAGIVYSLLRAADAAIITAAPTMIEWERLPIVWSAINEVESLRHSPLRHTVLLNRTIPRANSTDIYRSAIEDAGHDVLTATIPRRESFAQSFGAPITDVGAYGAAADEIALWKDA